MTTIRPVVKNTEWKLTKHEFYTAYHYALQYQDFKNQYSAEAMLNAVNNDGMPRGNNLSDPTYRKAIKLTELSKKIKLIEDTVKEADESIYQWLLIGVTNENCTFNYLQQRMSIPCGKNYYYDKRRKFYYLLAERIGVAHDNS